MRRVRRRFLRDLWHGSPLYALTLKGRRLGRLARLAPAPYPGSVERGAAISSGKIVCAGRALSAERPDWFAADLSAAAHLELNAFEWLDDLAALASEAAQARARALIEDWIADNPGWRPGAWDAEVTGRRLAAWLAHAPFLSRGDGDRLGPQLLNSASRQARHLARAFRDAPAGLSRLAALRGLAYAHVCGLLPARDAETVARRTAGEIRNQLFDDGFHAERGAGAQLEAVAALADIRAALEGAGLTVPDAIHRAIERLALATRFFRHGDGGLALFEDSHSEDAARIDAVLARAQSPGQPPERALDAGYERVAVGNLLLVVDAGVPAARGFDTHAHSGTLSFEMSSARERIVANCGSGPRDGSEWSLALRATAAHSTLTIEDTSASEPIPGGLKNRIANVTATRDEADGNVWLDFSHDGYAGLFGFIHRRRLFVARDGIDVRGEDSLVPAAGAVPSSSARFAIRFHLAPGIQASVIQNGAAALLRTASGQAWRLQVAGAALELSESVSFAQRGSARRAEQLVVAATASGSGMSIKWAFKRLAAGK